MADFASARQMFSQVWPSFLVEVLPFSIGASVEMKSMVTVRAAGPSGAPMSQGSGSNPGMSLAILARRHLRTDALQAWAIAAGESSLKSQTKPRSSVVFVGCVVDQPSLNRRGDGGGSGARDSAPRGSLGSVESEARGAMALG